jgi:hypothetical protein
VTLQKTSISVPLGAGVDTKTSDALVVPARLSRLENAVFTRPGELQKRPGAVALAASGLAADAQGALAVFENERLLAAGGQILSYSAQGPGRWYLKGTARSVAVKSSGIHADQYEQAFPDCATSGGVTLTAYESTQGGLYAVVTDEATGNRLGPAVRVDAAGSKPVVVACGPYLYVFYLYDAGGGSYSIRYTRMAVAVPGTFLAPVDLTAAGTLHATHPYFAVKPYGARMVLGYSSAADDLVVAVVTQAGQLGGLASGDPEPLLLEGPIGGLTAFNLTTDGTHVWVAWAVGTTLKALVLDGLFATARPAGNVSAGNVANVVNITGAWFQSIARMRLFFEVAPTTGKPYDSRVRYIDVPADATLLEAAHDLKRSVGLATEAFLQDDRPVVGVVFDSETQPTLFFVDAGSRVIAKALVWQAGGLTGYPRLPSVQAAAAGRWVCAVHGKGRFVSKAGQITYSLKKISRVVLDFTGERYRSAQLGKNLHLGGGIVSAYDGAGIFEHGFHVYPERPTGQAGTFGASIIAYGMATKRQELHLVPPDDDRSVQPVVHAGARVRPGQYVILYDSETLGSPANRLVIWFQVDGVGTAPGFGTSVQVKLASTDTQQDICRKICEANFPNLIGTIHPIMPAITEALGAGYAVRFQSEQPDGPFLMPVNDSDFGYGVTQCGTPTQPEKTRLVCPAGKWLTSGQWFQLESSYKNPGAGFNENTCILFYFVVDGVAPAVVPSSPGANGGAVAIPIASAATPNQVALAVEGAITGALRSGQTLWTATVNGPQVDVTCRQSADLSYGLIYLTQYNGRIRNNNVGGEMSAGTRQYFACYSWTDAQGQYHRSAPSLPFTASIQARDFANTPTPPDSPNPDAPGNDQETHGTCIVSVSTLRLTARDPASVVIELYRTEDAGQVPYLVATKPNDATVDAVTFTDALKDSDLLNAQPLYTAGGAELEAVPPPGSTVVATHRGRLFALDPDDSDLIWASKERVPGYAVEFNDELTIRVDAAGGEITAVWPQDDRTLIFKKRRILAFAGEGPNAAGLQSTWTQPEIINTDVGCVSADSLVFSPAGTFFKSEKGIYLLTRALEVRYVGAPVEAYNNLEVTSAVLMPGVTQVRFTTSGGVTLVFDYALEQWSVFTFGALSAALWDGTYHRLAEGGKVLRETPGAFVDDGAPVVLRARTSWLKLADVQGYGRVYKALLLGRYLSRHRLLVAIEYDYEEATREQLAFDSGAALGANPYGSGATYGDEPAYGGEAGSSVEQLDIRPSIQKCEAIRFEFSDDPTDNGESLALVHLQLVVGVKGPGWKGARTVGA